MCVYVCVYMYVHVYIHTHMDILITCMPVHHVGSAHGVWKRVLDSLELELWTVMSCHVGVGN